jgi:anti-anti-sigma regulatory factor
MKQARKTPSRARRVVDPTPGSVVLALPADCTLGNIGALRDLLCGVERGVRNITLDLRPLERFDTATLQLLAAFTRDHASLGANLLICGNRPAWDEAAQLLGLEATLAGRA